MNTIRPLIMNGKKPFKTAELKVCGSMFSVSWENTPGTPTYCILTGVLLGNVWWCAQDVFTYNLCRQIELQLDAMPDN